MLIDSNVYHNLCENEKGSCAAKILRLNLIGQITFAGINVLSLPIGFLRDRMSLRKMVFIGNLITISSVILFGVFIQFRIMDKYFWWIPIVFCVFIGLGQLPTYFATIELFNYFPPKYHGFLNGLLSCAWDLSALVFLLFNIFYFNSNVKNLLIIFGGYTLITCPLLIIFYWKTTSESLENSKQKLSENDKEIPSFRSQCFSKTYISLVIYTSFTMLHFYFFMSVAYDIALKVSK